MPSNAMICKRCIFHHSDGQNVFLRYIWISSKSLKMLQNLKSEMGVLVINEGDLDSAQGQGLVVGGQTV